MRRFLVLVVLVALVPVGTGAQADPAGWDSDFASCAANVGYAGHGLNGWQLHVLAVRDVEPGPVPGRAATNDDLGWSQEYLALTWRAYQPGDLGVLKQLASCMGQPTDVRLGEDVCAGAAAWWADTRLRLNQAVSYWAALPGATSDALMAETQGWMRGLATEQADAEPPLAAVSLSGIVVEMFEQYAQMSTDAGYLFDIQFHPGSYNPYVETALEARANADKQDAQATGLVGIELRDAFLAQCLVAVGP